MHNLTEGLAAVVEDVYQNISTEYSQSALHEVVAYIQDEDSSLHFLLDYVPAFITDYLPASRTGAGTNYKFMQILENYLTFNENIHFNKISDESLKENRLPTTLSHDQRVMYLMKNV